MSNRQWQLPELEAVLDESSPEPTEIKVRGQVQLIEQTLTELGFPARVQNVHQGPRLTQFALKPTSNTEFSKLRQVERDLAVALSGNLVEIESPSAGYPYVGVVVDNRRRPKVKLRSVIGSPAFGQKDGALKIGLGLNKFGLPVVIDLAALPHLLIGGTTGSGKSTCLTAIVASLLCTYTPDIVQLLLIDLTRVELGRYTGLPHLIAPVVSQSAQAIDTLGTIDEQIDLRYQELARQQVRDISAYNQKASQAGRRPMPYLIIAIDNVFDLFVNVPIVVEQIITRMARRARGAGIHLILSTPRAKRDTVSGSIKANFPGRIAFQVTDSVESRLILDVSGAETLLGEGDMLYKASSGTSPQRVQGVQLSEHELNRLVSFWNRA